MTTVPNILLVEDDPDIAKLTIRALNRAGFETVHVDDGQAAIDYLDVKKPDLILLDLNLPEVSGWEVLDHAKALYGEEGFKVIVTTANGDAANRVIGKLQLVVEYLIKPFVPDQLVSAIQRAMQPNDAQNA